MPRNPRHRKFQQKPSYTTKHDPNRNKQSLGLNMNTRDKSADVDETPFIFGNDEEKKDDTSINPKKRKSNISKPHSMTYDLPKPIQRPQLNVDEKKWKCPKCSKWKNGNVEKWNDYSVDLCECSYWNPIVIYDDFDPFKDEELIVAPDSRLGSPKHPYNKKKDCCICVKYRDQSFDHLPKLTHKLKNRELLYKCELCGVVDLYLDPKIPGVFNHLLTEAEMVINLYNAYIEDQPSKTNHSRLCEHLQNIKSILKQYFEIGVALQKFSTSVYSLNEYDKTCAIHLMGNNPYIKDYEEEVRSNSIFMHGITNCREDTTRFVQMMNKKTKIFDNYATKVQMPFLRKSIAEFANTIAHKISPKLKLATFLIILDPYQTRQESELVGPEHIDHIMFGNVTFCLTFNGQYLFNFPGDNNFSKITVNGGYILDAITSALFTHSYKTLPNTPQHCGRILLSYYDYGAYNLLHSLLLNNYSLGSNVLHYAWIKRPERSISNNTQNKNETKNKNNDLDNQYEIIIAEEMDKFEMEYINSMIECSKIAIVNTVETYAAYLQLQFELNTDGGRDMKINNLITIHQLKNIIIKCNEALKKKKTQWIWNYCLVFDETIQKYMSEDAWRRIQRKSNKTRITKWPHYKISEAFPDGDEQKDHVYLNESHNYAADISMIGDDISIKQESVDSKNDNDDNDDDNYTELMEISNEEDEEDEQDDDDDDDYDYDDDGDDDDVFYLKRAKAVLQQNGLGHLNIEQWLPDNILKDHILWPRLNKDELIQYGVPPVVAKKFVDVFSHKK